jgi:hypothetical protein
MTSAMHADSMVRIIMGPEQRPTFGHDSKWMAHAAEVSRHSDDLAPRADWSKQLGHLPCHAHPGRVRLLRSGEQKFDQLGRAVSPYNGEPRGSPRAQPPSHAGRHQAKAADESPPARQN